MRLINSLFLFLLLLAFHSFGQNQNFEITVDTINLNIKDIMSPASKIYLTHAVKHSGHYYCFFEEQALYDRTKVTKYFLIISANGKIEHNLKVPEGIDNEVYFDLHIRNDSIITKTYMDHYSFFLDPTKLEWINIKEVDDKVFEDEKFYVNFLDFGEWGSTLWFRDKKTGIEYEAEMGEPIINKINDIYYLSTSQEVFEIKDPLKMKISQPEDRYENVEKEKYHESGSNSLFGVKTMFIDTVSEFESKFHIITSILSDNQLFYLCADSNVTYIARLENGNMKPIQVIGNNIRVYDYAHSYRCKMQKDNSQIFKFAVDNDKLFGFFEIKGNGIKIRYLKHDIDSVNYLGTEKANLSFASIFDFVCANMGQLFLHQIDSIETQNGGTKLRLDKKGAMHKSYYPNKNNFDIEGAKVYLKIEDSVLANIVAYYYTRNDASIKTVFLEWTETEINKICEGFPSFFDKNEALKIIRFQNKFAEVEKYITHKMGKPAKRKPVAHKHKYIEIEWVTKDGLHIGLYGDDFTFRREIRLVIYKD